MANERLNYNNLGKNRSGRDYYFTDYTGIAVSYGSMFDSLNLEGCSFYNIEKSLCTYSISGFRNNLVSLYPSKTERLTFIIKQYE